MEWIYLKAAPCASLPCATCLIVPAGFAFLDRPAPAGNSRWISPRASRSCLSDTDGKKGKKGGKPVLSCSLIENKRDFPLNELMRNH